MGPTSLIDDRVLILEPNELRFGGPLLRPSITLVTLKNPNNYDVMYKFKTTAPRIYRVRPNLGIVGSKSDKTVRIVLMPFNFDLKERLVHKFMVLTAPAPDEHTDLRRVWANLDEGKLRCEKFKSIIEMSRPQAPISLEPCSSGTSAEMETETQDSCIGGDTSQSDDYTLYFENQKTPIETDHTATTLTLGKVATSEATTPTSSPRLDRDLLVVDLRAENKLLRDKNESLRHENQQLISQLERFRNARMEMEGSMAGTTSQPKRAAASSSVNSEGGNNKTNKWMLFLATSVTMAIVCAMIGKLVFPEKINMDNFQNFIDSMVN